MKINRAAGLVDETEVIVSAGEERAVGDQFEQRAVRIEARMREQNRERGSGREKRGEILFGPDDRVGEVERRADGRAVGGEFIRGEADDDRFAGTEPQRRGNRGKRLAGGAVDEIADDGDAGGLDARDRVVDGVEFRLVVAEIENRGNAAGERGKKRKIDRAGAAAGDDVAVF